MSLAVLLPCAREVVRLLVRGAAAVLVPAGAPCSIRWVLGAARLFSDCGWSSDAGLLRLREEVRVVLGWGMLMGAATQQEWW